MKLTLIPSSVLGSPEQHQFLSSAIINDAIALDAGCVGFFRSAEDQARIRHVLISHTHMDHLASLPIFVENAYEGTAECVEVHTSSDVIDCCQRDLFNNRIWPDFIALSEAQKDRPFLKMTAFEAGQTIEVLGVKITAVALDHVVPTVGYILSDAQSSIAFVSDTAPTTEIWQRLNSVANLKAVFLEVTFPNEMAWLADISKHLTPALFGAEIKKLNRPVRIIVVHMKARFQSQVMAEIRGLNLPQIEFGKFDVPYTF